ncbi:MAG: LmeA family phospholipid-binding protein [Haloechinothrix sp.]
MDNAVQRNNRPGSGSARPRKGNGSRKFVVFLVILAGVLVAADFGLAAAAEHQVSQKARERLQLTDDPAVNIHGFPFTLQALQGDYRHISVSARGIPVGDVLRELELVAELRDVHAPLEDVINGDTSAMEIGTLEGAVRIKQSDLGRAINLPNLSIEPAPEEYVRSGDEEDNLSVEEQEEQQEAEDTHFSTAGIRIAAETDIAGTEVEVVAFAIIELRSSAVRITPVRLEFGQNEQTTVVPEPVRQALFPQFETTINPGQLPFNVKPTGVVVERGALVVKGEAQDVTFANAGAG